MEALDSEILDLLVEFWSSEERLGTDKLWIHREQRVMEIRELISTNKYLLVVFHGEWSEESERFLQTLYQFYDRVHEDKKLAVVCFEMQRPKTNPFASATVNVSNMSQTVRSVPTAWLFDVLSGECLTKNVYNELQHWDPEGIFLPWCNGRQTLAQVLQRDSTRFRRRGEDHRVIGWRELTELTNTIGLLFCTLESAWLVQRTKILRDTLRSKGYRFEIVLVLILIEKDQEERLIQELLHHDFLEIGDMKISEELRRAIGGIVDPAFITVCCKSGKIISLDGIGQIEKFANAECLISERNAWHPQTLVSPSALSCFHHYQPFLILLSDDGKEHSQFRLAAKDLIESWGEKQHQPMYFAIVDPKSAASWIQWIVEKYSSEERVYKDSRLLLLDWNRGYAIGNRAFSKKVMNEMVGGYMSALEIPPFTLWKTIREEGQQQSIPTTSAKQGKRTKAAGKRMTKQRNTATPRQRHANTSQRAGTRSKATTTPYGDVPISKNKREKRKNK